LERLMDKYPYSLSVAMPAYNEEENIEAMIREVIEIMEPRFDEFEVVVTNDGSADRTGEVIREIAARDPRVKLVEHPRNLGYGAAAYSAMSNATKDIVFFTDSDRQFYLEEIDRVMPLLEENDLVVGYRAPRRDPALRVLYGKGWSFLVTLFFGYTARDIDCAFKVFHREVLERVLPQVRSRGATFSAELLVMTKRSGFRIAEVPVGHRPRVAGSPTGARLHVITRAFKELFLLRWRLWREPKPAS